MNSGGRSDHSRRRLHPSGRPDPLTRLHRVCAGFPEIEQRPSHGAPTWFVRGRSFVTLWLDGHHQNQFPHFWCAAPPGAQEALIATEPQRYFRPPYVGGRGWVGVRLDPPIGDADLAELCEEAYRAVAPKRLLAQLDAAPGRAQPDGGLT